MEERKELRLELREVRRKIFEAPPAPRQSSQQTSTTTSSSVNVEKENAKNLDLNDNKITLKTSIEPTKKSYSTNSKVSINLGSQPKEESARMNSSSVTRRSNLFDDNNNTTTIKSEPEATKPNGIKLKVNDDEVPTLRTRDPADRAARRARRAQQQREMSIDTDSPTPSNSATPEPPKVEETPVVVTSPKAPVVEPTLTLAAATAPVTIEKPKDEKKVEIKLNSGKPTATTSPFKTSNYTFNKTNSSSGSTLTANKDGGTGLRRSVTWGAKDKPGAANNIGKALGKFGGQVSNISLFLSRKKKLGY